MGIKKATRKNKATGKKPVAKGAVQTKKPVDIVQARENVASLVRNSATEIATRVIEEAKAGQLASAKYLFEVAGLYPATEETRAVGTESSLAHTLLKRMGLPTEPVICENDRGAAALSGDAKETARETARAAAEDVVSKTRAELDELETRSGSDTVE